MSAIRPHKIEHAPPARIRGRRFGKTASIRLADEYSDFTKIARIVFPIAFLIFIAAYC